MVEKTGQMGVPVILIDGQPIIGFDRLRLDALLNTSGGRHPRFGIKIADTRGAVPGAYIGSVNAGSTGERAGLKTGDIITEINTRRVNNAAEAERTLAGLNPGEIVAIKFQRSTETRKTEFVL